MKLLLKFTQQKSVIIIFSSMFIILLFDLIGVASIFPFLNLLTANRSIPENPNFLKLYNYFDYFSYKSFVYSVGILLVLLYFLKLSLKGILTNVKFRLLGELNYRLSIYLYEGILKAKYDLFVKRPTSEMIGIINAETIHSLICFESFLKLTNEISFLLIVLLIFFFMNYKVTLIVLISFGLIGLIIYFTFIKKIQYYGKIHTKLNNLIYKQGFTMAASIKDIKIMSLEKSYVSIFSNIWSEYSKNDARSKTIKSISSELSETFLFVGVVLTMMYLVYLGEDFKKMVPFLGFLGLVALRVLPAMSRIVSAYTDFKYYESSLRVVNELYISINTYKQEIKNYSLPFNHSIKITDLTFSFEEKKILDTISLEIRKGSSVGIVGSSGAGKSTLLDIIVGLRESQSGIFNIDGKEFNPFYTNALRNYVGYVPQNVNLIDESLAFNITFEKNYDLKKLQNAINVSRLTDFLNKLPDGFNTMLGEGGIRVSGGQKQRIGIARALYLNPEILIFDEATSALDSVTESELMHEINLLSGDKTIILVAHRLTTVVNCDCIYVLNGGKIIANGSYDYLMKSSPDFCKLVNLDKN